MRAADAPRLAGDLRAHGAEVTVEPDGTLQVTDLSAVRIGEVAAARGHVLHQLRDVTASLESFDTAGAGRRLAGFIDDLSNWYVRRSRRRFWDGPSAAGGAAEAISETPGN